VLGAISDTHTHALGAILILLNQRSDMNTESTSWIFPFDEVFGRLWPTSLRHRSQITEGFVLKSFSNTQLPNPCVEEGLAAWQD
jgi:hypothetical protein